MEDQFLVPLKGVQYYESKEKLSSSMVILRRPIISLTFQGELSKETLFGIALCSRKLRYGTCEEFLLLFSVVFAVGVVAIVVVCLVVDQLRIDQFRYIKMQHKTIDPRARLWRITTEFVGFIPQGPVPGSIVLG